MAGIKENGTSVDQAPAWYDDVALELWVDTQRDLVEVRLAGTLDQSTSPSFLAVVADLLASGVRRFVLLTERVQVEPDGSAALASAGSMMDRAGGTFTVVCDAGAIEAARERGPPGR